MLPHRLLKVRLPPPLKVRLLLLKVRLLLLKVKLLLLKVKLLLLKVKLLLLLMQPLPLPPPLLPMLRNKRLRIKKPSKNLAIRINSIIFAPAF